MLNKIIGEDIGVVADVRPDYFVNSEADLLLPRVAPYQHYEGELHYVRVTPGQVYTGNLTTDPNNPFAGQEVHLLSLGQCQNANGTPATTDTWGTRRPHWRVTGFGPADPMESVQFNKNNTFGGSSKFLFREPGLLALGGPMPENKVAAAIADLAEATIVVPGSNSNTKAALATRTSYGTLLSSVNTQGFFPLTAGVSDFASWMVTGGSSQITLNNGVFPRVSTWFGGITLVGTSYPDPPGTPLSTVFQELPCYANLKEECIYDVQLKGFARYSNTNFNIDGMLAYCIERFRITYRARDGKIVGAPSVSRIDRIENGDTKGGYFTVKQNAYNQRYYVYFVRPLGAGQGYDNFAFVNLTMVADLDIMPGSVSFARLAEYNQGKPPGSF